MINPKLNNLILAIVSSTAEMGGYVTKTKLLKLLYLFDVEYFRVHRQTFTGLDWQYFHLGPWTNEYDPLLDNLLNQSVLYKYPSTNPDYDAEFFKTAKTLQIKEVLFDFQDETILRRVLNTWADKKTAQILNYVYFQTEPIILGERYLPLDFSVIPEQPILQYRRSSSGKPPQQINAIRKAFEEKLAANIETKPQTQFTTPPKYDDEFWDGITTLEELAR